MNIFFKKSLSLFFALTLLFSPIAGVYLAPKTEAQLAGGVAGCAGSFVSGYTGYIGGLFSQGGEVPTDDIKNNIKECMDAVAYALAKTFLAKLTDSIITWINNGFDGNPFYIGDTGSFFTNVIKDQLQLALDDLQRTGTIYFDIIRQEAIYGARRTLADTTGFTLDQDIVRGLCGYAEYQNYEFCSQQLTPETRSELTYAFTRGYIPFQWSTWDSLTQNCGNNIFCANTSALNYQLAQRQERLQQLNDELNRGDGFLSQKVCKDPGFQRELQAWSDEVASYSSGSDDTFVGPPDILGSGTLPPRPVCREEIIQTPGRIIADKLTSNLGTTERQYELADELNESIAAVFNALINKLIDEGLSSFKTSESDYDENGNYIGNDPYYQSRFSENSGFEYDSTLDSLNANAEVCERAGGTYDEDLGVCDTDPVPDFPWTLDDGTIVPDQQGLQTLITTHPDTCIEIDSVRIQEGAEPCIVGTSSAGDGGFPAFPWTLDDGTIITNEQDYVVFVNAHLEACIQIDEIRTKPGPEPCITGVSSSNTTTGTATFTVNPEPLVVGSNATFTIQNGPASFDFEIVYISEGATDPEFLIAGVTDANGAGTASIQIPNILGSQVTLVIDFGDGESIQKVVQIR